MGKSRNEEPAVPAAEQAGPDRLSKLGRILGMATVALITYGVIANLPDLKRYVRMMMM